MNTDTKGLSTPSKNSLLVAWRRKRLLRNWQLYVILLPTLLYFLVFQYLPIYGVQIAFRDFSAVRGITGSPWVGWEHFERFFNSSQFWPVFQNTFGLAAFELLLFPVPIIFALLLNQLPHARFKRFVQTVTYAPHFISTVVIVGMFYLFLSPGNGLINQLLKAFGFESIYFMGLPEWFKSIFVFSGVWQNTGWAAIIYLAALTSIHPELHEAAVVDGANKFQRVQHIDVPGILPTVSILFVLNMGNFMQVGFEKVYLMQNSLNITSAEIIQTYVYKSGLVSGDFSYSTAVGLFNNVINLILLLSFNRLAKQMKQASLW